MTTTDKSRADALTEKQQHAVDEAAKVLRDNWEHGTAEDLLMAFLPESSGPQPAAAPIEEREVIEPLTEPVTIRKALLAGRTARVVMSGGDGPIAAVHLVNIGLTGWVHTKETAEAYAKGFNQAAKWMQDASLERQPAPSPADERAAPCNIVSHPDELVSMTITQYAELQRASAMLDWLEHQIRQRGMQGVSFDWVPSVDGEPSGYRYMRRHFIAEPKKTLRAAIDEAQRSEK